MKNSVVLEVTQLDSCKNRRFGGTYRLHPVTLMMEAIRSTETSVLTRGTLRNIPEDGVLRVHKDDLEIESGISDESHRRIQDGIDLWGLWVLLSVCLVFAFSLLVM
jgi:hypothetical protein